MNPLISLALSSYRLRSVQKVGTVLDGFLFAAPERVSRVKLPRSEPGGLGIATGLSWFPSELARDFAYQTAAGGTTQDAILSAGGKVRKDTR